MDTLKGFSQIQVCLANWYWPELHAGTPTCSVTMLSSALNDLFVAVDERGEDDISGQMYVWSMQRKTANNERRGGGNGAATRLGSGFNYQCNKNRSSIVAAWSVTCLLSLMTVVPVPP